MTAPSLISIMAHVRFEADCFGGIAQLGERLNGIQEVGGSNPPISTMNITEPVTDRLFSYFKAHWRTMDLGKHSCKALSHSLNMAAGLLRLPHVPSKITEA